MTVKMYSHSNSILPLGVSLHSSSFVIGQWRCLAQVSANQKQKKVGFLWIAKTLRYVPRSLYFERY